MVITADGASSMATTRLSATRDRLRLSPPHGGALWTRSRPARDGYTSPNGAAQLIGQSRNLRVLDNREPICARNTPSRMLAYNS